MFHIVLVEPEIPPNTGNIIRLCANTGAWLHLIEPLGFSMDDKAMRRAGLDYHEYADVRRYPSWTDFLSTQSPPLARLFTLTTKGEQSPYTTSFQSGDWLVFGSETKGLPAPIRAQFAPSQTLRLPMREGQRSLNLSNAVAVTVYEAWRQCSFAVTTPSASPATVLNSTAAPRAAPHTQA